MVEPAITGALITGGVAFFTFAAGWYSKRRRARKKRERQSRERLESRIDDLDAKVDKLYDILFGRDADDTDHGLTCEIDQRFSSTEERLAHMEDKLDAIVDHLVDKDDNDVEREDFEDE